MGGHHLGGRAGAESGHGPGGSWCDLGIPARAPGAFQPSASELGLRVGKFVHDPLKSTVPVSYSLQALTNVSPSGFQNELCGSSSWCQTPGLGCPV